MAEKIVCGAVHAWLWAGIGPIPEGTPCFCGLAKYACIPSPSSSAPRTPPGMWKSDAVANQQQSKSLAPLAGTSPETPAVRRMKAIHACPQCGALRELDVPSTLAVGVTVFKPHEYEGALCVACGRSHSGVAPDDSPTSYCELCWTDELRSAKHDAPQVVPAATPDALPTVDEIMELVEVYGEVANYSREKRIRALVESLHAAATRGRELEALLEARESTLGSARAIRASLDKRRKDVNESSGYVANDSRESGNAGA